VVFSTNGGSGSYSPVRVFAGETIEKPSRIPTLAAHVFTGWKVEGGGMWDFSEPVQGSMTLSAMWAQHFIVETDGLAVTVTMAGDFAGMNTHIDWGDGEYQDTNSARVTHTYARPMTGTITVVTNGLNSEESSETAFSVSADPVELKAVGSVDKDGEEWILDATDSAGFSSLAWYVDGERVGDSVTVRVSLSDGTHDIVLTVFDNDNNTKDWTTQITVGEDSAEDHTIAYVVILLSAIIGILATARMGPQGLLIIVIGGLVGFFMM
ncbi:MAG: PKD domain-containing protein, partial [Candidatus Methanomethylophilaceae archaeon]